MNDHNSKKVSSREWKNDGGSRATIQFGTERYGWRSMISKTNIDRLGNGFRG